MLPVKQPLSNGLSNQFTPKKMLFPVKTVGTTVLTNHQSNLVPKSNGNTNNHSRESPSEKIFASSRRIPRLIRSPNVVDDHNNNLFNESVTSYKLQNGTNNCNDLNLSNGKECHLNLINNSNRQNALLNGQINGNSTKIIRMRNSNILKSPNFRTRVKSEDE